MFADETDTQNFDISYRHQHFESSSSSLPSLQQDTENDSEDDKTTDSPSKMVIVALW